LSGDRTAVVAGVAPILIVVPKDPTLDGAAGPMQVARDPIHMSPLHKLFTSSLGRKFLMAVSGALLFGFVIGHLLGNLQIFLGADAINAYGHFLQSKPGLVWSARLGLLALVLLHIWSAITLARENRAARPVQYASWNPTVASYASRTMVMSGVIIAAFIIYHLLHFTVQTEGINFTGTDFKALHDAQGRHDVYGMMVTGFGQPLVSMFYLVAMALLCLHLGHGLSAMFQSLGLKNKAYGPLIDKSATGVAWLVFLGYASIPLAVLVGVVK
jgi:succinate dehydrogenase / fumarate reductase, cytochrome b subunit